jgi:hypothetical protein
MSATADTLRENGKQGKSQMEGASAQDETQKRVAQCRLDRYDNRDNSEVDYGA